MHKALAEALEKCQLPKLTLYQCTRPTFASQWVMNGGSLELLAKIMGHSSTSTTQHYAPLAPDFFGSKAFDMVTVDLLTVDLAQPKGDVVALRDVSGPPGPTMATTQQANAAEQLSLIG